MSGFRLLLLLLLGMLVVLAVGGCGGVGDSASWLAVLNAGVLQVSYGSGTDFPQYAALHLSSGYLRLVPSRTAGWGTSVVLMPSLWTGGTYHQGAPITTTPVIDGADLLIPFTGTIAGLQVTGQVRLSPPSGGTIRAAVTVNTTGSPALDNRPGEAFKPVMFSSMHISPTVWDAQSAYLGAQTYPLPTNGWILQPPVSANVFGLDGGTSTWKTNAPTIEVTLDQARPITGWVTASADPNDDNVGLWAAADTVLTSWNYTIIARE
jgi:hypothetical protein